MTRTPRIVLVSDDPTLLAVAHAALSGCEVLLSPRGPFAAAAALDLRPEIVLIDARGTPLDGPEVARAVKAIPEGTTVPVLVVGADASVIDRVAALDAGADDLLAPLHPLELGARVRALLRSRAFVDRFEDATQVLFALANAVEAKDPYTEGHTERVGALSVEMGRRCGLSLEEQDALYKGGVLHDIGKIGIPNEILNKVGPLSPKERIVMNKHPEIGERILEPLKSIGPLLPIIRHHHEKLDGTGYPDGLKGAAVPIHAQIVTLADIFDAITTDRPYHRALSRVGAIGFCEKEADKGWRDHGLVRVLSAAAESLGLGRTEEELPPRPGPVYLPRPGEAWPTAQPEPGDNEVKR